MTATPPFDPPYKCRTADGDAGTERWFDVLADGTRVACAAPVLVVPAAAERPAARAPQKSGTILNVPYAEKEEAKQLGARWDPKRKKWYVPPGADSALFERWLAD